MAHFAEIGSNSEVLRVVVVNNENMLDANGVEQESIGAAYLERLFGGAWVQTSYNAKIRKNYAGVGYSYDAALDAFVPPQPFPSWSLNRDIAQWESPVPRPSDGQAYSWDEAAGNWVVVPKE